MRVLIFNWRDRGHPKAGGAERSTHTLARGLAFRGHDVTWFSSRHRGSTRVDSRDGYGVLRIGDELTCRFAGATWFFERRARFDIVIDEVNTLPFLTPLFSGATPVVLWMHQLAREVWFAETSAIVGRIGYATEAGMLSLYRRRPVVTVSQSSAQSIRSIGLKGPIYVAENALQPPCFVGSARRGLVGYVGRVTRSKRIDHIIEAIALECRTNDLELVVIGGGSDEEFRRLKSLARTLNVEEKVKFLGHVCERERDSYLASFDILAMASMREGWGLVVSEAARYGVPSVVYPVPGLIDSVQHRRTGLVAAEQSPRALGKCIVELVRDRELRDSLGRNAMAYISRFDEQRFVGRWESVLTAVKAGETADVPHI